jgi:hypothetical protein
LQSCFDAGNNLDMMKRIQEAGTKTLHDDQCKSKLALISLTGAHGYFKFEDLDQFKFVDFGIFATSVISRGSKVDDVFLQLRFSVFPGLASSRRI